jgi:putative tryptophan/tyrosine transport system substrate-binding protein
MAIGIGRRHFISALSGAALALPLAARAQQGDRVRRIAVLLGAADDSAARARIAAFLQALQELGWTDRHNVRIDYRWGAGDPNRIQAQAVELVALKPDVILVQSERAVTAVQQETRSIPVVFIGLSDPVGRGIVQSVARPGGNITGFTIFDFEFSVIGKHLEVLKQIAPSVARVVLLYNPANSAAPGWISSLETIAPSFSVRPAAATVHDAAEIEQVIEAFAKEPNGGLLLPPDATTAVYRELIITLAARLRLPAVYSDRVYVGSGGLISYGPDRIDQFRRAAAYIDRILKGEKPADLPVQAPTKYELVINQKTAKALGLTVPPSLLATADEVIE